MMPTPAPHPHRTVATVPTDARDLSTTLRSIQVGGFLIREHQVRGRQANPRHSHEYQCIGFLVGGLGTAEFTRDEWVVRPGFVNVIPAGVGHIERFGTPEIRWCGIELPTVRDECASEVHRVFERPHQSRGGPVNRIASRIYAELRLCDATSALALHGLGLELLALLARRPGLAGTASEPAWLRRAEEYVRSRFLDSFSLDEVAEEARIHPTHLARVFRRSFGVSVGEYVRNLRVDHAAGMLRDSDLPLSAIAITVGFSDQAHFTRVFKRRTGVTPGVFRSNLRTR